MFRLERRSIGGLGFWRPVLARSAIQTRRGPALSQERLPSPAGLHAPYREVRRALPTVGRIIVLVRWMARAATIAARLESILFILNLLPAEAGTWTCALKQGFCHGEGPWHSI